MASKFDIVITVFKHVEDKLVFQIKNFNIFKINIYMIFSKNIAKKIVYRK